MKKKLLFITTLLIFCLTACGTKEKDTEESDNRSRFTRTESAETSSDISTADEVEAADEAGGEEVAVEESEENVSGSSETTDDANFESMDYDTVIETLKQQDESYQPETENIATSMANLIITSQLLETNKSMDFDAMSDTDKASLNLTIINSIYFNHPLTQYIPQHLPAENSYVPYVKADLENIFHSFYEHSGELYVDGNMFKENTSTYSFVQVEAHESITFSSYSFKERGDFMLISAPCYYMANEVENKYMYNADILLKRNPDSLFGMQVLYAKAYDAPISIAQAQATSQLASYENKSYGPENLYDGSLETAWAENVDGTGVGQVITLHLGSVQPVLDVVLYTGYLQSKALYDKNGKPTNVEVNFGDGNIVTSDCIYEEYYETLDDYLPAIDLPTKISLPRPVMTDTITITITDAIAGTHYSDTCISEIEVH